MVSSTSCQLHSLQVLRVFGGGGKEMATEKRLIRADATADAFTKWLTSTYDGRMPCDIVAEIPTVDAVEVVRCKDCIHWHEPNSVCLKIYSDGAASVYAWQDRKADDFCSYGERKDND